jgi:hypothetical protein|tara:strand:+ start:781 stop:960 length:180 start_codon:yes stop_codon:yes gene_type:complete
MTEFITNSTGRYFAVNTLEIVLCSGLNSFGIVEVVHEETETRAVGGRGKKVYAVISMKD